jgi:hypothetical protein
MGIEGGQVVNGPMSGRTVAQEGGWDGRREVGTRERAEGGTEARTVDGGWDMIRLLH